MKKNKKNISIASVGRLFRPARRSRAVASSLALIAGAFPGVVFASPGDTFSLNHPVNVYLSSGEAEKRGEEARIYEGGEYFIYAENGDFLNLTKEKGSPGGWINRGDLLSVPFPMEYEVLEDSFVFEKTEGNTYLPKSQKLLKGSVLSLPASPKEENGFFVFQDGSFIKKETVKRVTEELSVLYFQDTGTITGEDGSEIGREEKGYKVMGEKLSDGRFLFVYEGKLAFVDSSLLSSENPVPQKEKQAENTSSGIISLAKAQVGKPYVFGSAGPSAFDCSGLVLYLYQNAKGISLPHSAAAQKEYGKSVSFSEIQPGDLLFFGSPAFHVGIYVGNGYYVHASTPERGVVMDSAYSSWVQNNLSAVKRY